MSEFFEKKDVTAPTTITRRIYEHELLLAFKDDAQCEAFLDWLQEHGFNSFKEWTIKHGDSYRG